MTRGAPESPLCWTCKSTRALDADLEKQGYDVSPQKVGELLKSQSDNLQAVAKSLEGEEHPDRNAQFEHINAQVQDFQTRGQPVISVDTKKKELVGEFKNGGHEWQPAGAPVLSLKAELQRLADATGLAISVSHFPPGTSKFLKPKPAK